MIFTDSEYEYLAGHPLGRLATIGPDGAPQIHPVAFWLDAGRGTIDIGGPALARSQKFRIHPLRIITWNIGEFGPARTGRLPHLQGYRSRNVPG